MSTETEQFLVEDVRWGYAQSREITGNRSPAEPVRSHVESATVTCKACSFRWRARDYEDLKAVIGGTRITCPECDAQGFVHVT